MKEFDFRECARQLAELFRKEADDSEALRQARARIDVFIRADYLGQLREAEGRAKARLEERGDSYKVA